MQRSTRLRFLYLRLLHGISSRLFDLGGMTGVQRLTGREFELQGQAVFVHSQVQLGGQSSLAMTDTSISTLFFWAAACW